MNDYLSINKQQPFFFVQKNGSAYHIIILTMQIVHSVTYTSSCKLFLAIEFRRLLFSHFSFDN